MQKVIVFENYGLVNKKIVKNEKPMRKIEEINKTSVKKLKDKLFLTLYV